MSKKSQIHNDDRVGNFQVTVVANTKSVASFQTRTREAAMIEARRVEAERLARGLRTKFATAKEITGAEKARKGKRQRLMYGKREILFCGSVISTTYHPVK
jgi:hypothetical protein